MNKDVELLWLLFLNYSGLNSIYRYRNRGEKGESGQDRCSHIR